MLSTQQCPHQLDWLLESWMNVAILGKPIFADFKLKSNNHLTVCEVAKVTEIPQSTVDCRMTSNMFHKVWTVFGEESLRCATSVCKLKLYRDRLLEKLIQSTESESSVITGNLKESFSPFLLSSKYGFYMEISILT